ncbi:hypothetical protein [Kineococcus sp. SYSU DK001]|uniref:hypothetical protein n=1 Tax=Kineococcus sp. SYSU DK001 TaxID=3383122 RepID=UPI003D7E72E0
MRSLLRHPRARHDPRPAIAEFWAWWLAEGADGCAAALDAGDVHGVAPLLTGRVGRLHPALAWSVGSGQCATGRRLTVTANGDPAARSTAHRWFLAAPPETADWSYRDERGPALDLDFTVDAVGRTLASGDVRASWEPHEDREHLDVRLVHPAFAGLDGDAAAQLAFDLLDAAVGERAVELWVGAVTWGPDPAGGPGAGGLAELRAAVEAVAAEFTPAHDTDAVWKLAEGLDRHGRPVLVSTVVPLSPAAFPLFDRHLAVELGYPGALPGATELAALRGFEDELDAAVGQDAAVVAHVTVGGTRTVHLYGDALSDVEDVVRAQAARWTTGPHAVSAHDDPAWERVADLTRPATGTPGPVRPPG